MVKPAPKPTRQIEYRPLAALQDNPHNPKTHALGTIGESVGRFGYVEPIVIDERTGYTISGHGRTAALRAAEEQWRELTVGEVKDAATADIPDGIRLDEDGVWLVPVVTGWSSKNDADARAALIALNRTTELGGWDDSALADLLDDLAAQGDDGLVGVGFDTADLDDLMARLQEQDAAPSEPTPASTGTRETPSMNEYRDRYEEQGRRLIVLDYDHAEYPDVTARLRRLRERYEVESNADAIAAFLADEYPDVRGSADDGPAPEPGDRADYGMTDEGTIQ